MVQRSEEETALVEMEVCRRDVALTQKEAEIWQREYGIEPEKMRTVTEYLYCYPVYTKFLQRAPDPLVHELLPVGEGIVVGSMVINQEPQCPMDGCTRRYENAFGKVLAIFPDYESAAEATYEDDEHPEIPVTEYWYTNIYQ